jgi:nicotinate-nucleotide adenylyltransferase
MLKLCLGGTFNPIHHGHLICARAVAEALGYDQVVLIPTHITPQKLLESRSPSAEDRLAMCRLAAAETQGVEVDDREIRRPGPSYTIDTVRELRRAGWETVSWLLGADQVSRLPTWRQPLDLLREAHLIVMTRPGWVLDLSELPAEYGILIERVVPAPSVEISSTDIRRRVAEGKPIEFLTTPGVCRYIKEKGLYGGRHGGT